MLITSALSTVKILKLAEELKGFKGNTDKTNI